MKDYNITDNIDLDEIKKLIGMPTPEQKEPEILPERSIPAEQPQGSARMPSADAEGGADDGDAKGIIRSEEKNDVPTGKAKAPAAKTGVLYDVYTIVHDLVTILAVISVVFVFFFRLVCVDGSSMFPTLVNHDYLILQSNVLFDPQDLKYGDVVVANVPYYAALDPIVKRVIATSNQVVDIDFASGTVTVDGEVLEEPYIYEPTYESFGIFGMEYPLTVPEGCVFLMGDNRNNSSDSRYCEVGCVDLDCILGKALLVMVPGHQTDAYGQVVGAIDFGRIGVVK